MDFAVIRFNCSHCSRYYELPDAMQHLPLLCKGCGQRLVLPEPSPNPVPTLAQELAIPPIDTPAAVAVLPSALPTESIDKTAVAKNAESIQVLPEHVSNDLQNDSKPTSTAASVGEKADEENESTVRRKPLAKVVDAFIVLVLIAFGSVIGEMLARKSTTDVWNEAGHAIKFPPVDLLLWLSPPTLFVLIYGFLISRRKSLGWWLNGKWTS